MMHSLKLSAAQANKMIAHAAADQPLEACGLLAGKCERVENVIQVRNQAQSPLRYVMDPVEQLNALEWIDSNELDLLGIYHSHPSGPETVSARDVAEAAYAVVYVVLSLVEGAWRIRGFWIENEQVEEVILQIGECRNHPAPGVFYD